MRDRAQNKLHTVGDFSRKLRALQSPRSAPAHATRPVSAPRPGRVSERTARRRREVLVVLGAAFIVTFLLGFNLGGMWWATFALATAALGAYVWALMVVAGRMQADLEARRAARGPRHAQPAPEYVYRRGASS